MIGPHVRTPVTLTRRVSVDGSASVTIEDLSPPQFFKVELTRPRLPIDQEGSPRSHDPWVIRWRTGMWGPVGATPGGSSRITVGETSYELLSGAKTLMYGRRAVGFEARCLPVTQLYPYVGDLTEQDGTVVQAGMRFAFWSPNESHGSTGDYEDYEAEAPIEYREQVKRNRQLHLATGVYRIMVTVVELVVPRVVFRLRRAGG
jgi:hypothetical protein